MSGGERFGDVIRLNRGCLAEEIMNAVLGRGRRILCEASAVRHSTIMVIRAFGA